MSFLKSHAPLFMAYVGGIMSGMYVAGGKEVSELLNIGSVLLWTASAVTYSYVLSNYAKQLCPHTTAR